MKFLYLLGKQHAVLPVNESHVVVTVSALEFPVHVASHVPNLA